MNSSEINCHASAYNEAAQEPDLDRVQKIVPSYNPRTEVAPSSSKEIMALGDPGGKGIVLDKKGYKLLFSHECNVTLCAYECLTSKQMEFKTLCSKKDKVDIYEDEETPFPRLKTNVYKEAGYENGHLAAAGNHAYNIETYKNTFCFSNIAPMFNGVNNLMKTMEEQGRNLATSEGKVYIFTGPIFDDSEPMFLKPGSAVRVPNAFFKVIVHKSLSRNKDWTSRQYIIPNTNTIVSDTITTDFMTSISNINALTGLNLLCGVKMERVTDCFRKERSRSHAS